jgi:leucyl-tRNA synthetase
LGYELIRFTNEEVIEQMPDVLLRIKAALDSRPDFSAEAAPPLLGRGAGGEGHSPKPQTPTIEVFTTRPDTLFGVTFLTLAPEHELVPLLTTDDRRTEVEAYVTTAKNRSERERQAEVDKVSGVFTGSYAKHPFTGEDVPVWVGDYVLGGYGTGAVMAVPGGDQRDWRFATHFGLPIIVVTEGADISNGADESKEGTISTEGFLKGLPVKQAIPRAIEELVKLGAGERRINFRLRDAAFGRQRYWGEPIPIYYKDGIPYPLPESELPLKLPEVDKFLPTEDGEPPLARAKDWHFTPLHGRGAGGEGHYPLETTTMPGWAGSSWYFLRYMDPHNAERLASPEAIAYWQQIDLYMGGSEHATGHLLYFRFWTKFLHDRGWLPFDEPAKKLVNQGMIQGVSALLHGYVFNLLDSPTATESIAVAIDGKEILNAGPQQLYQQLRIAAAPGKYEFSKEYIEFVREDALSMQAIMDLKEADNRFSWLDVGRNVQFEGRGEKALLPLERVVEKMSKSKFNVVNPDDIIAKYGADTLRLYEMFLGPLEQSKPWDTNGIEGTFRFLRKFWNLFHGADDGIAVSDGAPTKPELKTLHATLKKVTEDIEKMSFNTSVSQFMIAANELGALKCNKRAVLEPLVIALAPFAPHIAEELWEKLGHSGSVTTAKWPQWQAEHLVEDNFSYPISFNGKTRLMLEFPIALSKEEVEAQVLANPEVQAKLEGKAPKKVIVVPKRIVNIVV